MLTQADEKHYAPMSEILDHISRQIPDGARVLEFGPGQLPFHRATQFVDILPGENTVVCDLQSEKLPFPDKYFDFVYCRHVMEDLTWPFPALAELSRVGRAGHIETPSPMAEAVRGVDGNPQAWRGYYHHSWFVWNKNGVLHFLKKMPMIEHLALGDESILEDVLRQSPVYWNSYYPWQDEIKWQMVSPAHPAHWAQIVEAIREDFESTNAFLETLRLSGTPVTMAG